MVVSNEMCAVGSVKGAVCILHCAVHSVKCLELNVLLVCAQSEDSSVICEYHSLPFYISKYSKYFVYIQCNVA